jgi:hypothetical protein
MKRLLLAVACSCAGFAASAQTVTPGLGGVAVTGNSGAGIYIPYSGGRPTIGAPGVGSYTLGGGGYTAPYSWSNYSNPTAYNFNAGTFNYNTGVYQASALGLGNTVLTGGSNVYYPSGSYYYPTTSGTYSIPATTSFYTTGGVYSPSVAYPTVYSTGRGRFRMR